MTPEIPPPPKLPTDAPPPLVVRGAGWRASIPSAVIVALITTTGTVLAQACTSSRDIEQITKRLDRIEARLDGVPAQLARHP